MLPKERVGYKLKPIFYTKYHYLLQKTINPTNMLRRITR
jgi:hypothetical protein